jgi:peptide/nickel transport system ATP-binding protein
MSVLQVRDLTVDFAQRSGPKFRAVDKVSFELRAGETLALVGESGSGKSTIARALGRLVTPTSGELLLHGDPAGRRGRRLRNYRHEVQLVFQDPFASLNPAFSVGHHLRRPLLINGAPRAGLDLAVEELLRSVNLGPPGVIAKKYPHELSGGQRQRVAIARALAPRPTVMLADEPVSMLDVSIRLEILNLLDALKRERNLALLYITHDLATARHFSTQIMVMYRGEIVERGPADDVILNPAHPYTQLLASAVPKPTVTRRQLAVERRARQETGKGGHKAERSEAVADTGCRFRRRCPHAMEVCARHPPDFPAGPGHIARCWLHDPALLQIHQPDSGGVDAQDPE